MGELTLEEAADAYRLAKDERDAAHVAESLAYGVLNDAQRRKDNAVICLEEAIEQLQRVSEAARRNG